MVTHDVQEAFELADRICLMDKGKIVQCGSLAELLFHPANAFVKNFLKDQRLQLEFRAVKLNDIWDWLPEAKEDHRASITADTNLWTSLESFKFTKTERLNIRHHQKKETKSVGFEQLMSAFYQYKKQQPHE